MLFFKEEKTKTLSVMDVFEIGMIYGEVLKSGRGSGIAKQLAIKAIIDKTGCSLRTATNVAEVEFRLI